MKINYNNTALGILDNPDKFDFHLPGECVPEMNEAQGQVFGHTVIDAFKSSGMIKHWRKDIQLITQPFYEAYHKSNAKIREIFLTEKFSEAGTLVIPWKHHTQTIFYCINTKGEIGDFDYTIAYIMFTKSPKLDTCGLDVFVTMDTQKNINKSFIWKGFVDQGRDTSWFIADLILFKTFMRYADAETKYVNGQRKEHHLGQKYVNETKRRVEILDSTYFTTIMRTEGLVCLVTSGGNRGEGEATRNLYGYPTMKNMVIHVVLR